MPLRSRTRQTQEAESSTRAPLARPLAWSDYALWTPKWLVETFVDFQIPEDMLGEYAPITVDQKRKILGLNAAALYDINVPAELRLAIPGQDTVDVAAGAKEAVPA